MVGRESRSSASEEEVAAAAGSGAFTEEALSGWRSPPLPRLSAQTQTAPEEEDEVEMMRESEKSFRNGVSD